MVLLKLDLQDGFEGDLVIVKVNSSEVFRKENVKTRLTVGYALSFEVDIPAGNINIEVSLPQKGIHGEISIEASGQVFMGISVQDNKIIFKRSESFFTYL